MAYFADLEFIAGDVDRASRGVVARRSWPGYWTLQLFLPTRGALDFRLGDGPWHRFTTPTFYWHHPQGVYSYHPGTEGWHHHWIAFRGERGRRLVEEGFMPLAPAGFCPAGNGALAGERFRRMVACLEQDSHHAEGVILLESLLVQAMQAVRPESSPRLADLLTRLEGDPLAVCDFTAEARALGITPGQLRRLFVAATGRPPRAHLLRLRMQAAARLLSVSSLSVAEVARRCGLSPGRFSRQFHACMGVTARRLRLAQG